MLDYQVAFRSTRICVQFLCLYASRDNYVIAYLNVIYIVVTITIYMREELIIICFVALNFSDRISKSYLRVCYC